jgi:hypothetical protein
MAASTYSLLQIRTDLKRILVPEGNSPWEDEEYDRRISAAIREIAETKEITELETSNSTLLSLSTSTRSYSYSGFSPSVFTLISVRLSGKDYDLIPLSRDQADNLDQDETGEPTQYLDWGQSIEVYPLPSSTYLGTSLIVRYISDPVIPESDAKTSPLPASYDRAILNYAAFLMLEDNHESERAKQYLSGYLAMIRMRKTRRTRNFAKQITSISTSRR